MKLRYILVIILIAITLSQLESVLRLKNEPYSVCWGTYRAQPRAWIIYEGHIFDPTVPAVINDEEKHLYRTKLTEKKTLVEQRRINDKHQQTALQ